MSDDVFCLTELENQQLIDEYTSRTAAVMALAHRVRRDPSAARSLAILQFDEEGHQLGAPIRMPPLARRYSDLAR